MYLIIDEQYRIYKSDILSGYIRCQARRGKLSVVNLKTMQGINMVDNENYGMDQNLPEWSDIQDWDPSFKVEAS